VEAYRCERSSKWVGILLCPSVIHQQSNLGARTWIPEPSEEDYFEDMTVAQLDESFGALALRLQPATIPFLDSDTRVPEKLSGYALVPLSLDDNCGTAARAVVSARNSLEDLRLKASQPRAQEKYLASLTWLESVYNQLVPLGKAYRGAKKNEQQNAS
jgi:hypothetical protein